MENPARVGHLVGRILLSVIFVLSGLGKIAQWSGTAQMMASKGMPLVSLLLPLTILVELGGGLMLLTGFGARFAAVLLALFLVPTTLIFHNFWAVTGPEHMMQQVNFLKNVAIIGGLLVYATSVPPGDASGR